MEKEIASDRPKISATANKLTLPLADKVLLRPAQVVALGYVGSKVTLWRAVKAGQFPKPVRIGPNAVGYRRTDLDAWLAAREPA